MLQGHVVLIVRDYNQILHNLLPQVSCLFEDIVQTLDQQIQPGLLRLNWIVKGIVGWHVTKLINYMRSRELSHYVTHE